MSLAGARVCLIVARWTKSQAAMSRWQLHRATLAVLALAVLLACPASSVAGTVTVTAGTPTLVATATSGYLWFPQTLATFPDNSTLLLMTQACEDEVHPHGWSGTPFVSTDGGASWSRLPDVAHLSKVCVPAWYTTLSSALACLPYPLSPDPITPPNGGVMALQNMSVWEAARSDDGRVTVSLLPETPHVVWSEWKRDIVLWGSSGLDLMVTDGGYVVLADSHLMAGVYGRYVGDVNTSLSVLTSDNGGRDWHYLAVAANATGTGPDHVCGSASEHDFVTLDDGSILGVYRTDGVNGGSNQPLCQVYSRDNGVSWTAPVQMAAGGPHGVEPKIVRLSNGVLAVSGGRFGLFLWLSADGQGKAWTAFNLAAHHNDALTNSSLHFDPEFVAATADKGWSTSYTSMVEVAPNTVLVCYDRLANGWSPPPGPWGTFNSIFCVRATVSTPAGASGTHVAGARA